MSKVSKLFPDNHSEPHTMPLGQKLPHTALRGLGKGHHNVSALMCQDMKRAATRCTKTYCYESRFQAGIYECLIPGQRSEKFHVRRDPDNSILIQRFPKHPQGLRPVPSMHDNFRNHWIVEHTNL